jgi:hypothetical protein
MTVRQEIHAYIDDISENKLIALKPLLSALADESIIIERDLTEEERNIIAKGMLEYESTPDSFIPIDKIK